MKLTRLKLIITFFTCSAGLAFSQLTDKDIAFFNKYQDSLLAFTKVLYPVRHKMELKDSMKEIVNAKFSNMWEEVLLNQLSFEFDFDSLKKDVTIIKSSDEKVRIINWNIPLADGTHKYYGFIQSKHPKTGKYVIHELTDVSETIKNPETYSADHTKWYGMLYYDIIKCEDYYTLLGWDGNDKTSTKKIIDILSFKNDGVPVFGKNVFNSVPNKYPKRFILEFSSECTISVRYHDGEKTIKFNNIAPPSPYLEGMYAYYVPDGSFNAFEYKRGSWNYVPDIDARNPKSRNDVVKKPKNNEKPVYVPH